MDNLQPDQAGNAAWWRRRSSHAAAAKENAPSPAAAAKENAPRGPRPRRRSMSITQKNLMALYQNQVYLKHLHSQARISKDWRLRLAVFLNDPFSSKEASVFSFIVCLVIFFHLGLLLYTSGSFDAQRMSRGHQRWAQGTIASWCTLELLLRTVALSANLSSYLRGGLSTPGFTGFITHISIHWSFDMTALVSLYLGIVTDSPISGGGRRILCLLQALRMARLFKISKQHPDIKLVVRLLGLSKRALTVPFAVLILSAVFLGTLIYNVEHIELNWDGDCDEKCPGFPDVGNAVWFMSKHSPPATARMARRLYAPALATCAHP